MSTDLELRLTRELDEVASRVVVPAMPALPAPVLVRTRWPSVGPVLAAAVALVAVMATVGALLLLGGGDRDEPAPAPSPTTAEDDAPLSRAVPALPYVLGDRLYLEGERVPGAWSYTDGSATGWVGQRVDGTWWWGYDTQPQVLEGSMDQPPTVSLNGTYLARIVTETGGSLLVGADTLEGGEASAGSTCPPTTGTPHRPGSPP